MSAEDALVLAQSDATQTYRELSGYSVRLTLEVDGWHVDYELKDSRLKGGGPHYLIDPIAGVITSKVYEQ